MIEYELLVQAPEQVLRLIYEFLGEPWFEHDFCNVHYDVRRSTKSWRLRGQHRVRPQVALDARRTILLPDLFEKYAQLPFWRSGEGSAAHVIRAKAD